MTVKEAYKAGFRTADVKFQRGYLSRKTKVSEQHVLIAGGHRAGQLYFLKPCYTSTRYCLRVYLKRPD